MSATWMDENNYNHLVGGNHIKQLNFFIFFTKGTNSSFVESEKIT
jgi:hypothetical protein